MNHSQRNVLRFQKLQVKRREHLPLSWWIFGIVAIMFAIAFLLPERLTTLGKDEIAVRRFQLGAGQSPDRSAVVVDGDTIRINGERLRVIGVNAPEIDGAKCDRERVMGKRAKTHLERLLSTRPYTIVRNDKVDRDGRGLVVLIIDGKRYTDEMLGKGLGVAYNVSKHSRHDWCGITARQ